MKKHLLIKLSLLLLLVVCSVTHAWGDVVWQSDMQSSISGVEQTKVNASDTWDTNLSLAWAPGLTKAYRPSGDGRGVTLAFKSPLSLQTGNVIRVFVGSTNNTARTFNLFVNNGGSAVATVSSASATLRVIDYTLTGNLTLNSIKITASKNDSYIFKVIIFGDKPATGSTTISYEMTKGTMDVQGRTDNCISTISGFSSTISLSNFTTSTSNGQPSLSGQILGQKAEADYDASYYADLHFTVANGYTFTPSSVSMKWAGNSTELKACIAILDGTTTVTSNESTLSSTTVSLATASSFSFESGAFTDKSFAGTVHIRIYMYGKTGQRAYLASGFSITGTVAAASSCSATANAGADKSTTYNTGVSMAATAASSGYTGAWSIKTGSPSTSTSQLSSTSAYNATFTPNAVGTYTLIWTVTDNSDGSCSASDEATVTVSKANISPSLSYESTTLIVGDDSSSPTVSGNSGSGSVSYAVTASSPSGCISVNTSTGVVTANAAGTGTVTATVAATTNYNGNTCTADFTVNNPPVADHVSISGEWAAFVGYPISITATPYDDEDNAIDPTGMSYQWYKDGTADGNMIDGETSATLNIASATTEDYGSYYCKISKDGYTDVFSSAFGIKIMRIHLMWADGAEVSNYTFHNFEPIGDSKAVCTIALEAYNYSLQVLDGQYGWGDNNEAWFGRSNYWGTTANPWTHGTVDHKTYLNCDIAGDYVFTLDYSSGYYKMGVMYPQPTYYYKGNDDGWSTTHEMTKSCDGTYAYFWTKGATSLQAAGRNTNNNNFLITNSDGKTTIADGNKLEIRNGEATGFGGTDIWGSSNMGKWDGSSSNASIYNAGDFYIVVFYPNNSINTTNDPKICASTKLPGNATTADEVVYFEKPASNWGDKAYYRIGHRGTSSAPEMELVPGTARLYQHVLSEWTGYEAWSIANNSSWQGSNNSIYQVNTGDTYSVTKSTNYFKCETDGNITIILDDENNTADGCTYYNVNTYSGMLTHTATVGSTTNGSIQLDWTDTDGDEQTATSTTSGLAHTCNLTVTGVPATGYDVATLTVDGDDFTSGDTHVLTDDATIAATFALHNYNVTYSAPSNGNYTISVAGGSATSATKTATYGQTITLAASPSDGYEFSSWTVTKDGGGTVTVTSNQFMMPADNVTITATFTAKSYNLTWNLGGGTTTSAGTGIASGVSANTTSSVTFGASLTAPTVTKTGYNFSAWSPSVASTMPAANTTYTAQWTAQQYTISYKDKGNVALKGDTLLSSPKTHTYGTATALKKASRDGYVFKGWYTNNACTGDPITSLTATDYTANITLYADWDAMTMVALADNTLYKVEDMVPDGVTMSNSNRWYPGVSANNRFNIRGSSSSGSNANGGMCPRVEEKVRTIDGVGFTNVYGFRKPASGTDGTNLGTGLPDNHAIQFKISGDGLLDIYCYYADSIFMVKDGGSAVVLAANNKAQKVTKEVTAGTYYLYSTRNSTHQRLYGLKFTPTYAITHSDATNGSYTIKVGSAAAVSTSTNSLSGETITLAATPSSGYVINGWNVTGATVGNNNIASTSFTMPAGNVTVAPTFKLMPNVYYYQDGTRYASSTYKAPDGSVASSGNNTPINSGDEWTVSNSISGLTVSAKGCKYDGKSGSEIHETAYLKVPTGGDNSDKYVKFVVAAGYKATSLKMKIGGYSSNPTVTLKPYTTELGDAIIYTGTVGGVATKENNFNEISWTNLAAGTYYLNVGDNNNAYISEITAQTESTGYVISFAGNGNTGGSTASHTAITSGDNITLNSNGYTKTGYDFSHWTANVDVTVNSETVHAGDPIEDGATIENVTSNIALTAQWTELEEICETMNSSFFDAYSAAWEGEPKWYSTVNNVRYSFDGQDDENTSLLSFPLGLEEESWINIGAAGLGTIQEVKITFGNIGAGNANSNQLNKGITYGFYDHASTWNYELVSFYNKDYITGNTSVSFRPDDDDQDIFIFKPYGTPLEITSICIYYEPASYTLTWSTDGDVLTGDYTSGTVAYGTPITAPNTPTKTGYTFDAWSPTPAATMPAANTTYTATWTADSYTITLNKGDHGAANQSASVSYDATSLTSITHVTSTGYDRTGYYDGETKVLNADGSFAGDNITGYITSGKWSKTSDATLTAKWSANQYSVSHSLSHATKTSGATGANAATYGTDYTAVFAASSGYALPNSVMVTAGGSDITASCTYTKATGTVLVPGSYITGNIVITVTGVATFDFRMIADADAESELNLANDEAIEAGKKNCTTISGGTAVYSGSGMKVQKGTPYGWYFGSNSDIITITLSGKVLQTGSTITIYGYSAADKGFAINGVTTVTNTTGNTGAFNGTYTVQSTDADLINKNELAITRVGSSAIRMYSISISNCATGTPCVTPVLPSLTTPNSGCTTGDFAEWDASVTNSAAISAASGDQEVTYSWTNSSSVEVGTDATFTPTSAGTYTVTVTVHSETSGYIDATATSSTLTASLYGNPSVTGPSDANYVVGASASNLSVTATPTHGESLTYQWYSNTAKSTSSPTPTALENCTTSTYKPSTAAAGTTYYFCKVSGGCEDVYSSIATVAVSEAPCFTFSCESQSSSISAVSAGGSITAAMWDEATLTGGSMTNSAASQGLNVNRTYGLVFDSDNNEVTVTLSGDNVLAKDAVITLSCYSLNDDSKSYGFKINGNNMSPATYTPTADSYETFTQSYTIPTASALIGTKSFKIKRYNSNKVYLNGITVTGCDECEGITPSLSYSKTTLWVNDGDTSTPTLDKDESTGSVTYSSSNTDVATVNESTGVVTAVAGGNVTITASIAADGTHCANTATCNLTIKQATCGEVVIAGVTLSAKDAGTPEGTLIASSSGYVVSCQKWETPDGGCGTGAKLGEGGNYICLTLKSGESFKNGDKVILDIATVPDVGDSKLHIYAGTSSAGTQLGENASPVCGENEIILSGISSSTPSITLYRTSGDDKQNPYVVSMKVKRFICTDCLGFVDATENGNWNTAGNWIGSTGVSASVPTISDRVHIYKPVTVDINNAKASNVYIYTNSSNTGKVTIDAGNALIIAGKLAKSTNGTSYTTTAAADVIINSTRAAGTGALIIGGETGTNAATVNFETKVKRESGTGNWINQFIGSPFSDLEPYVDYALQIYAFRPNGLGNRGYWNSLSEGDDMEEFVGHNILYNDNNYLDVQWTGTLNASSDEKTLTGYYGPNTYSLFANSWVAPIHIGSFESTDFANMDATIYIFNAGTPQQEKEMGDGDGAKTDAGTYAVIPINSGEWIEGTLEVIPAMQAFFVNATAASPSLTLDYSKLVYTPALTSVGITPTRAPRRSTEEGAPEVIRLRVAGENGWAETTYLLGREDFTEGFDNGWDGRYMEGEDTNPQLYAPTSDGNMAVNCVPQIEGTVLGFRKGNADSQYTFSFEYAGEEEYYLKDLKLDIETRIDNESTYAFTAEAGDNAARFIIVRKTPAVATGVDNVDGEGAKVRKLIINDKVYIIRGGQIYSVDGALVVPMMEQK